MQDDLYRLENSHFLARRAGWWPKIPQSDDIELIATKLCLIHSEVSEALEGVRKGLMDDHLPQRTMFEVELADVAIRVFDLAGAMGIDLPQVAAEKLRYNQSRADHRLENRTAPGGKKI